MRVIAGTARSIRLDTPPGNDTRPTTDKIKETLFNILQFDVQGALFLDLFAGSGGIGIEALSRGAMRAWFSDTGAVSVKCIKDNLKRCKFEEQSVVLRGDAMQMVRHAASEVKRLRAESAGTVIFMDPPYDKGLEFPVLRLLMEEGLVDEETIVIIESSLRYDLTEALDLGYEIYRVKEYKNQKHTFLRKALS